MEMKIESWKRKHFFSTTTMKNETAVDLVISFAIFLQGNVKSPMLSFT